MECRAYSENLTAFIDGELSPEDHRRLAEHLDNCQNCKTEHDSLLFAVRTVERYAKDSVQPPAWGLIEERISTPKPSWSDFSWLFQPKWAGALALMLLVLSLPFYLRSTEPTAVLEQQLAVFVDQRDQMEEIHQGIIETEPVGWVTHNPFRESADGSRNPFASE